MVFNTGSALLDAVVLAIISKEAAGTYGYKITQEVCMVLETSESTLYPVLRRLLKEGFLEAYDMEYAGRNRRYYKLTPAGQRQLEQYRGEWRAYSRKITEIFGIQAMKNTSGQNDASHENTHITDNPERVVEREGYDKI